MSDFLPVLLGSDANVYGMARSFYQQYGVRSVAICKGALVATSNTNLVKIAVLEPDLENDETFVKTLTDYAKAHADKPLVLVAAGTPPEAPGSNALPNLDLAVQYLLNGAKDGVQIAYDGLHPAWATTEADCNDRFHHASVPFVPVQAPAFHRRRILQITPHPGIDYGAFDLTGVDAVLHRMYHSATVPEPATAFAHRCKEAGVPCLFVTPKPAAAYVTAAHLPGVWTSTTPESAFAKLLLTNGQDFDTMTLQVNENR